MNQWAVVILTAFSTLAIRALIAWLIERYVDTAEGGTVRECDEDLGDAGSGDTRIYVFEASRGREDGK